MEYLGILNDFWTNPNVGPYSISTRLTLGPGGIHGYVGGSSGGVDGNWDIWFPDLVPTSDVHYPTRRATIAGEFGHKLGLSADPANPFAHADGGIMNRMHWGDILPSHIQNIVRQCQ